MPADLTTNPDITNLVAALSPAQREAVLADDPVVCVLAGAGTGKTRVLTLRVARRVLDGSAHANHVLVCTFSRRAADELRHRLWSLGVSRDVQAGTLHRAALRLLALDRRDRGRPSPVIVADRRPILAGLLDTNGGPAGPRGGGPKGGASRSRRPLPRRIDLQGDVRRLDAEISWAKSRLVPPSAYEEAARQASRRTPLPGARIAELYRRYEETRQLRGALDLDDLLWQAGDLLEEEPAFARAVRWWHRHVFVDEMQDLNDAQYRLLRLLVGEDPDLFVVGDPNQSVYGWNGADPELLLRVTEEYAGTRVVRLETNHRCAAPVVRVAAAVLGEEKAPPSARGTGPLPSIVCFPNELDEAAGVAHRVWLAHRPGRTWSSIAVLARTNAQLARIAQALDEARVPNRTSGAELGPGSDVRGAQSGGERAADGGEEPPGGVAAHSNTPSPSALEEGEDAVVLSTFHRAKGLQWRTVFVVGLSDGLVPLVTARSSAARAEEQRLLYVAVTRAEEELTCTWALRPDAADACDGVAERHPSPWLAPVASVLETLREGMGEASPESASAHLRNMRELLSSPALPSAGAGMGAP